ncbi:tetratricopeptide repeat protein [Streptomyces sp. ISL-98]|nr:tetratricopeptide repeat protein [Streptomyces sp. ISL-98]
MLAAILNAESTSLALVVHGMAGCGKTAIARILFDEAVAEHGLVGLWVNAATELSFRDGMLAVAQDRGATQDEVDAARERRRPPADLAWHYLELSDQPWLLVLDNADDPDVLGDEVWLRPTIRGTLLVTTRHGNAPLWNRASRHHLDVLNLSDAVHVLLDLDVPADDQSKLEVLAHALGCHPLALVLAGTYLGHRLLDPVTVDEFLERLRRDPSATLDEGADPAERDLRRLISSTWQISLDALTDRGIPEAATLIRLLSCFAPVPLPIGVLHATRLNRTELAHATPALVSTKADIALQGLLSQSLVTVLDVPGDVGRPDVKCIQTHALLLDTVAARIPMDQREAILEAATTLLHELLVQGAEEGEFLDSQSLRLFTPHASALLQRTHTARCASVAKALNVVRYLRSQSYDRGDYPTAHALAMQAAQVTRDAHTADALKDRCETGRTLIALGRFEEAIDVLTATLHAREDLLGTQHPDTLDSAYALGIALYGLGRWAEDEQYMRRAAEGRARALGSSHPDTIDSFGRLAEAIGRQGRWTEAEPLARSNLEVSQDALGDDHPHTLLSRLALARVLDGLSRGEEAAVHTRATLEGSERVLGPEHPRTLAARQRLAAVLTTLGQWDKAQESAESVRAARQRILGTEHPHTLSVQILLIKILHARQQHDTAVELSVHTLDACTRILGDDHPDTVACRAEHDRVARAADQPDRHLDEEDRSS